MAYSASPSAPCSQQPATIHAVIGLQVPDRRLDGLAPTQPAPVLPTQALELAAVNDLLVGVVRRYFPRVQAGQSGHQYAVGRTTNVAGLFYAYPVFEEGRFLGAAVVKRDITRFADWTNQAGAFISDANGIIVLTSDKQLENRALPGASIEKVSANSRVMQYKRSAFEPTIITPWGDGEFPGAVRIGDIRVPVVLYSKAMPEDAIIAIHVPRPLGDLARLATERNWHFMLLATAGSMLIAAVWAVFLYLRGSHAAAAEREVQATELKRLNRALRVLSQCNETLVRTASEDELVRSICRHVVEIGGYRLAWVGYAQHDQARSIEPAAHAGTDRDYVDQLHLSWGDDERRRGVGGTAVRERRTVLARDISTAPVFEAWRAAALQRGLASCIALPLQVKGDVLGMLSIYAEEDDAFDGEEIKVLQELTDDLAYGIASLRESEERKRVEQALEHQAKFDALTGLANRFTLEARLTQSVADAKRHGNKLALMFVDLDRFKLVNDTLGHGVGDQLLSEVACLLTAAVRESDTVARLGGDEFVVLLKDIEAMADAATVASKLIAALNAPLRIDGHEIRPSASIGISLFPDDGDDVGTLMRNADTAMYHAKALGGGSFRLFAPQMNERMAARFAMEADLRRALGHGELLVYYQPQVSLSSGVMTGAEALVRWRHPSKGMVSPAEFIPLAEETGLIEPLGEWVIGNVCRQLRAWLDAGVPVQPVAVNLSARQFRQSELVSLIARSLADNRLDPGLLTLEITEGAVMHDVEAAVATVKQLKALGVRLSLDDFGTGYSSLSYLKRFPIDHLKIDRSFVREVTTDPDSAVICNAVIGLAHSLRMTVIAEGVETEAQMQYLRRQRCDEMQGYLFSKPVPAQEFAELLGDDRRLALPVTEQAQPTVLIVDDEASVVSALKRLLRRDGYRIITAGSAREGLELLATQSVEVILSDQRMPGMSGTEFLSRVKDLYPQTIRIILSGYTELESVIDAINRGAIYRFFTKPWDDAALRKDIHAAFHHHALIHGRELAPNHFGGHVAACRP
jgi:diguanylate cyclase (GGDEF)-like protein